MWDRGLCGLDCSVTTLSSAKQLSLVVLLTECGKSLQTEGMQWLKSLIAQGVCIVAQFQLNFLRIWCTGVNAGEQDLQHRSCRSGQQGATQKRCQKPEQDRARTPTSYSWSKRDIVFREDKPRVFLRADRKQVKLRASQRSKTRPAPEFATKSPCGRRKRVRQISLSR